jgi:hypothetical protein
MINLNSHRLADIIERALIESVPTGRAFSVTSSQLLHAADAVKSEFLRLLEKETKNDKQIP